MGNEGTTRVKHKKSSMLIEENNKREKKGIKKDGWLTGFSDYERTFSSLTDLDKESILGEGEKSNTPNILP